MKFMLISCLSVTTFKKISEVRHVIFVVMNAAGINSYVIHQKNSREKITGRRFLT
jgi:hypothetical protein